MLACAVLSNSGVVGSRRMVPCSRQICTYSDDVGHESLVEVGAGEDQWRPSPGVPRVDVDASQSEPVDHSDEQPRQLFVIFPRPVVSVTKQYHLLLKIEEGTEQYPVL